MVTEAFKPVGLEHIAHGEEIKSTFLPKYLVDISKQWFDSMKLAYKEATAPHYETFDFPPGAIVFNGGHVKDGIDSKVLSQEDILWFKTLDSSTHKAKAEQFAYVKLPDLIQRLKSKAGTPQFNSLMTLITASVQTEITAYQFNVIQTKGPEDPMYLKKNESALRTTIEGAREVLNGLPDSVQEGNLQITGLKLYLEQYDALRAYDQLQSKTLPDDTDVNKEVLKDHIIDLQVEAMNALHPQSTVIVKEAGISEGIKPIHNIATEVPHYMNIEDVPLGVNQILLEPTIVHEKVGIIERMYQKKLLLPAEIKVVRREGSMGEDDYAAVLQIEDLLNRLENCDDEVLVYQCLDHLSKQLQINRWNTPNGLRWLENNQGQLTLDKLRDQARFNRINTIVQNTHRSAEVSYGLYRMLDKVRKVAGVLGEKKDHLVQQISDSLVYQGRPAEELVAQYQQKMAEIQKEREAEEAEEAAAKSAEPLLERQVNS